MACGWCAQCDGTGSIDYTGWVLARRQDSTWLVYPWADSLGGTPLVLDDEHAPAEWKALKATVASRVELIASGHGTPAEHLVEVDQVVAAALGRVQSHRGQLRVTVGGVPLMFRRPVELTNDDAQTLQRAPLWTWQDAEGQRWWQFENAGGFVAEQRVAQRERRESSAQRHWREARAEHFRGEAFVNPYNFVPLGEGPARSAPGRHLALQDGRVSGKVAVRLTALTPLALSGTGSGTQENPYRPLVIDNAHFLAGSHLAGAVRAFHEALTDSCLRVIDTDYRPVHRDVARPQQPGRWRMAVVEGDPLCVRLCDPVSVPDGGSSTSDAAIWVEARDLGPPPVHSGQEFHFDPAKATLGVPANRFRLERSAGAVPALCSSGPSCPQDHWRTIVTEPLENRVRNPRGNQHAYHLPFARIGAQVLPLSDGVLKAYRRAAHDAADVVARRGGAAPDVTVPGIGVRQEATEALMAGTVVWVELQNGSVVRVSRSVLWRHTGEGPVRDRIGAYAPCTDPEELCPSCRLFGMAEEREQPATGQRARMAAYRGHVRFGHATISAVDQDPVLLREMGTPHPSAGQFYLDNGSFTDSQARKGERPLREWGSEADRGGMPRPRRIRGRKFYWSVSGAENHLAGADPNAAMTSHHLLTSPGETIEFAVWFDSITREQLGSLLVALNPNLLADGGPRARLAGLTGSQAMLEALDKELCHHTGKGKGVGLGVVRPELVGDLEVWTVDRYRSSSSPPVATGGTVFVEEFVDAALAKGHPPRTWPALLAMAALNWVPAERVSYPPDDHPGGDFKFDFWRRSTGAAGTVDGRLAPLVSLPAADAEDVTVPRPWLDGGR